MCKISIVFVLLLTGFAAAQEIQAKSCGLELNVTEPGANGRPIQFAISTATSLATKRTVKAGYFEGFPVFGNLRDGRYKLTVKKAGYKTTVKEINLDCRQADTDQNSVSENIVLRKGSGKQIYNQTRFSGSLTNFDLLRGTEFFNFAYQSPAARLRKISPVGSLAAIGKMEATAAKSYLSKYYPVN